MGNKIIVDVCVTTIISSSAFINILTSQFWCGTAVYFRAFVEHCSHLSTCWVNTNGSIQLLLGNATLHGYTEALCHLPRIRTQVVEPNHLILRRTRCVCLFDVLYVYKRFCSTSTVFRSALTVTSQSTCSLTLFSLLQMTLA